jgi:hypothetical protein
MKKLAPLARIPAVPGDQSTGHTPTTPQSNASQVAQLSASPPTQGQQGSVLQQAARQSDNAAYVKQFTVGTPNEVARSIHLLWQVTNDTPTNASGPVLVRELLRQLTTEVLLRVSRVYYSQYSGGAGSVIHAKVVSSSGGKLPNSYARMIRTVPNPPIDASQQGSEPSLPGATRPLVAPELYSLTDLVRLYTGSQCTAAGKPGLASNKQVVTKNAKLPDLFARRFAGASQAERDLLIADVVADGSVRATVIQLLEMPAVKKMLGRYASALEHAIGRDGAAGHEGRETTIDALYQTKSTGSSDDSVGRVQLKGDGTYRAYREEDGWKNNTPDMQGGYHIRFNDLVFKGRTGEEMSDRGVMSGSASFTWGRFPGAVFVRVA